MKFSYQSKIIISEYEKGTSVTDIDYNWNSYA